MPPDNTEISFEAALEILESAISALESGGLDLDQALASYERGVQLVTQCRSFLDNAEKRVALIASVDPDGTPRTTPLPQ